MRSLRLVLRNLRKSPGFAVYTILSLALGIGANTALFSIFDEIILKPLPVVEPDRLVVFHSKGVNSGSISSDNYETSFSYPMYLDLTARLATGPGSPFEALIARAGAMGPGGGVSVAGLGEPDVASAESVTGNFFDGLGLKPAIGRLLNQNDDLKDGGNPVVVVSYGYWKEHFGGRTDVVGQKLLIDNHPMEIVGVAPEGFGGMITGREPKIYYPLHLKTVLSTGFTALTERRNAWIDIFGRLRPGATSLMRWRRKPLHAYRAILEDELRQMKSPGEKFKREFASGEARVHSRGPGHQHPAPALRDATRFPHGHGRADPADRLCERGQSVHGSSDWASQGDGGVRVPKMGATRMCEYRRPSAGRESRSQHSGRDRCDCSRILDGRRSDVFRRLRQARVSTGTL